MSFSFSRVYDGGEGIELKEEEDVEISIVSLEKLFLGIKKKSSKEDLRKNILKGHNELQEKLKGKIDKFTHVTKFGNVGKDEVDFSVGFFPNKKQFGILKEEFETESIRMQFQKIIHNAEFSSIEKSAASVLQKDKTYPKSGCLESYLLPLPSSDEKMDFHSISEIYFPNPQESFEKRKMKVVRKGVFGDGLIPRKPWNPVSVSKRAARKIRSKRKGRSPFGALGLKEEEETEGEAVEDDENVKKEKERIRTECYRFIRYQDKRRTVVKIDDENLADENLAQELSRYCDSPELFESVPITIDIGLLIRSFDKIKKKSKGKRSGSSWDPYDHYGYPPKRRTKTGEGIQVSGNVSVYDTFVEDLEAECAPFNERMERMLKEGVITFRTLWYIFKKDTKIIASDRYGISRIGSTVRSSIYEKNLFAETFVIRAYGVESDGRSFFHSSRQFRIGGFEGIRNIDELPVTPITEGDEDYKWLTERGKVYGQLGIGHHYRQYKGSLMIKTRWNQFEYNADGRILIDISSYSKLNAGARSFNPIFRKKSRRGGSGDGLTDVKILDPDHYWMTESHILGFSFKCKKWGDFDVEKISMIEFDDEAYEKLVLEKEKKGLIRSLVTHHTKTFSDFIKTKGGGVVMLLHGTPGVGKTLTCEAISEMLHRPLYSVTVGELGISPIDVEAKLGQILEVCSIWKAVILIDEADIFLERRTTSEIRRNALVGIFLRMLEYHEGILFLTTNRIKNFDPAVCSRISLSVHYEPLTNDARLKIWNNFFQSFGLKMAEDVDVKKLSEKYEFNGRQIKNIVRMASTLAIEDKNVGVIRSGYLEKCIKFVSEFDDYMEDGGGEEEEVGKKKVDMVKKMKKLEDYEEEEEE